MCGINGLFDINLDEASSIQRIQKMNSMLSHRGPDSNGFYFEKGLAIGHTRLSILDLSNSADQPMHSFSGRYVLTYNGEIYNFKELSVLLTNKFNIKLKTTSDTEVLVNLIECLGLNEALNRIEGMFAFGLFDRKQQKLFLARDRFGEKPLYWFHQKNILYFSSEISPLINVLRDKLSINFNSVNHFLKKSYVPNHSSIFHEVQKVEPASYIEISLEKGASVPPKKIRYWNYEALAIQGSLDADRANLSYHEARDKLESLLDVKIQEMMVSDVPLGAFLSGGYDSSCVVSLMQKNSLKKIKTFSIGFDDAKYNEAEDAKKISEYLGTEHQELYLSERDLLDTIIDIPNIYSEPFADSSQIPTILLSKLTRSQVTVSLSGDGGDEIFGGYARYFLGERVKNTVGMLPYALRKNIKSMNLLGLPRPLIKAMMQNSVTNFDQKYQKLINIFDYTDDANLFNKLSQFDNRFLSQDYKIDSSNNLWSSNNSYFRKAMICDAVDYLPGDILTKVDIAGMSASLETRIPFLNHQIAEYAASLPLSFLHKNNTGKYILKDIVHKYIPQSLMDRPKKGFDIPLGSYLRNELRDFMESKIKYGKNNFSEEFNFEEIETVWQHHYNQEIENPNLLWNLATFFAWHENYF